MKTYCRLLGWLLVILGVVFMPLGYGVSPKRDLSLFHNLADLPAFVRWAFGFLALGAVTLVAAYLIPGELDD